jgi:hypothetical protein
MAECSDHRLSTSTPEEEEELVDCADTSQLAANTSVPDYNIASGRHNNNLKVTTQLETDQVKTDNGSYILVDDSRPSLQEIQSGNAVTRENDNDQLGRADNQQCRSPAESELQEKHDPVEIGQAAGHAIDDQIKHEIDDQIKPGSSHGEAAIGQDTDTITERVNTSSSKQQKNSSRVASFCEPPDILPPTPTEPNTVRNIIIDVCCISDSRVVSQL